ncbi:aldose 1-epimerase [Kaistia dalseonensis]|uniref:Aldose 1-epimerase n=1 Tax=Kaistia dalseonensis TaxID=410840 RepID=A0ABU0H3M2_9HYPH|nr:aldose 1-epimerase [Kaistia dalseonensis]MCX5494069.1 aldose 1-epimerase [Kaistia dalseonensis]MDQ0436647.1 aldose 1-epimerase [Kaistia dalseonensis]
MAAISEPVELIGIRSGAISAEIVPEIGGGLASFRFDMDGQSVDLMRPLSADLASRRNPVDTAMFPMMPYANRIADNRFVFEGREYLFTANNPPERFNVHGTAWHRAWTVESQGADQVRLTLSVEDPALYSYDAAEDFVLDQTGLAVTTSVTNRGAVAMPFGFGQHPWFPRDPDTRLTFAASHFWLDGPDGVASDRITVPPELDFSAGARLPEGWRNNCYSGWSGDAEIRFPKRGCGLRMRADPVFGHLMFYADPRRSFFCLEPQSNSSGAFDRLAGDRTGLGIIVLQPGETASGTIRFEPFRL